MRGLYLHLWYEGLSIDFLDSRDLSNLGVRSVVWVPYPTIISEGVQAALADYVTGGGTLVCGPCPAARKPNTWVAPQAPPPALQEVFGCRQADRIYDVRARTLRAEGVEPLEVTGNCCEYDKLGDGATTLAAWENGAPAAVENACGKGRAVLLGFLPGLQPRSVVREWFHAFVGQTLGLDSPWTTSGRQGEVRRLAHPDGDFLFVFNPDDEENEFAIRRPPGSRIEKIWGRGKLARQESEVRARLPRQSILVARDHRTAR